MRDISIQLADDFRQAANTRCFLFKVMPVGLDPLCLTTLDQDIDYDDGSGLKTYKARRGVTPYAVETAQDLSVDNSQMQALISEFELDGFTVDAIRRGVYDDARFVTYAVNYLDLSHGHVVVGAGFIGQVKNVDGLTCFPELRSLSQTLKQKAVIERGSNSCRAQFGDARCQFPVDDLWTNRTVTAVGLESDRTFTINGSAPGNDDFKPGVVEWLTGDNAGKTLEVESNTGAVVTLAFPTDKPIQNGDTLRIRADCTKLWDGPRGCKFYDAIEPGQLWRFRGEPFRPVADTASLMVPKPSRTE